MIKDRVGNTYQHDGNSRRWGGEKEERRSSQNRSGDSQANHQVSHAINPLQSMGLLM
jgi:hypothetical protein